MNDLEKRIIDLSYKLRLSHIGSCLNAVNVLDHIYNVKKKDDPVILSSGHMGLALYVVLEAKKGKMLRSCIGSMALILVEMWKMVSGVQLAVLVRD